MEIIIRNADNKEEIFFNIIASEENSEEDNKIIDDMLEKDDNSEVESVEIVCKKGFLLKDFDINSIYAENTLKVIFNVRR